VTTVAALYAPVKRYAPTPPWPEPEIPDFSFNRNEPPVRQTASWTCSCASLAWVMNALGVEAPTGGKWDEWDGVNEVRAVGGPGAVSPDYGLAYASGVDLENVYQKYGFTVRRALEVTWETLAYACGFGVGQLGGARWYHWTGLRDYDGDTFLLANPAPTWKGVGDDLDAYEWNTWGRWNAVMVVGRLPGR
jgi:hypothetical protein